MIFCLVTACGVSGSDAGSAPPSTNGDASSTTAGADTTTSSTAVVDDDPDQALADAADATLAAPSFGLDSEANLEIGAQKFRLGAKGSVDYDSLVAKVTISVDSNGKPGEVEIRSDGTTLWVRPDAPTGVAVPDGKTWVEGNASRLRQAKTFDQPGLIGVLLALRAANDSQRSGSEEIDGVKATDYTTTVDYAEAVKAAGKDADAFKTALSLTAPGQTALDIEVAVGADGIIRRFRLDIDSDSSLLGGDYRVDLSDVGQAAEAPDAPPKGETLTGPKADKLLDQLLE